MSEYCCFCCCCPAPTSPPRLRSDARVCGWKTTTMHYNKYTPPPPPPLHLPLSCPSKTCLQAGLIKGINEVEDMLRYNIAQAKLNERGNYGETANQPTNQPPQATNHAIIKATGRQETCIICVFFNRFTLMTSLAGGTRRHISYGLGLFLYSRTCQSKTAVFDCSPNRAFLHSLKRGVFFDSTFFD